MAFIKFKWVKDDREDKILYQTKFSKSKPRSKTKKDFVLNWENNLDWSENPFKDEILMPVNEYIAGREKEKKELNLFFIHGNRFGSIKGSEGQGKSFLLKWLGYELVNYQKKYIVCYLPAKELKYDELLKKIVKPFSSMFKSMDYTPKNVFSLIKEKLPSNKELILLLDDLEDVSSEHLDLIKHLYNSMKNVTLLVSLKSKKIDLSDFGDDQLGLTLKDMGLDDLKDIIKIRIENVGGIEIEPFSNVQIKTLSKKANNNPRKLLGLCNKKAIELSLGKKEDYFEDEVFDNDDIKELEEDLAVHSSSFDYENSLEVDESEISQGETVFEGDIVVQEILKADKSKKKTVSSKDGASKKTIKKK